MLDTRDIPVRLYGNPLLWFFLVLSPNHEDIFQTLYDRASKIDSGIQ